MTPTFFIVCVIGFIVCAIAFAMLLRRDYQRSQSKQKRMQREQKM